MTSVLKQMVLFVLMVFGTFALPVRAEFVNPASGQLQSGSVSKERTPPSINLVKRKYIRGERVFFWIKACPIERGAKQGPAEDEFYLEIQKPDGSIVKSRLGSPSDGMVDACWSGGHRLPDEDQMPGVYRLVVHQFELTSQAIELTLEDSDILQKIDAGFKFPEDDKIKLGADVPYRFYVNNNTSYPIIFPGSEAAGREFNIGLGIKTENPPCNDSGFAVIPQALGAPGAAYDPDRPLSPQSHGWGIPGRNPGYITLNPGERYEKEFSFKVGAFCYQQTKQSAQQIRLSMELEVYVGDKGGEFTDYCPIKQSVQALKTFTVVP